MTTKEFAKNKNISERKVKVMAPYIDGAVQCPLCKKWQMPEDATPIYIPNKTYYAEKSKMFCYILDAISLGHIIHPELSCVPEDSFLPLIDSLADSKYIARKNINKNAFDCRNYQLTIHGAEWLNMKSKDKSDLASNIILALLQTVPALVGIFK